MKKQTLETYIEQATKNITDDRAAVKSLLMNIMNYMNTGADRHKEVGLIAAKYLETLQRSNEQLVKLASLLQKREKPTEGISYEDKQELFEMINTPDPEES